MISEQILKNLIDEKMYKNVLWEYDSNLVQLLKKMIKDGTTQTYNLKVNTIKTKYDVMIVLKNNSFQGYCNCRIGKQGKNCEHLIYAGLKINEEAKIEKQIHLKQDQTFNINIFKNLYSNTYKQEIKIIPYLKRLKDNNSSIEFKVTSDNIHEYKIPNLAHFIELIMAEKKLHYGKFLDLDTYHLTKPTRKLINTLEYIILHAKNLQQNFDLNEISNFYLSKILLALNLTFIKFLNKDFFISNDLNDINLNLVKVDNNTIKIHYTELNDYIQIADNILYSENNRTIYFLENEELKKIEFLNFFQANKKNEINTLEFQGQDKDLFLNEILPNMYNDSNLHVDTSFKFTFIEEKLLIKLFCYKTKNSIRIKPLFQYGEYELEFNTPPNKSDVIIKRNIRQENFLYNELSALGYQLDDATHEFYIDVARSQFLFLTKNIFDLKQRYEVNLDEKLKKAILNFDSNSISVNINNNSNKNYFNINIDLKDIKNEEIDKIIQSYENKQIFYKLTDGSFLQLNDQKIYNQLLFIRNLGNMKYKMNEFRIPKYRALLMSEEVKNKFSKVSINQEFIDYIDSFSLLRPLDNDVFKNKQYKLRNYQKKAISWINVLYDGELGGLLADEMGLGKTLETISFIQIRKITNSIIVVPKALLYNWEKEFQKFAPEVPLTLIDGDAKIRKVKIENYNKKSIIITSYSSILNDFKLYKSFAFDCVIIDEAQYIKNPMTKTAISTKSIKGKFFLALTGTPVENNLQELWSIFDFILPGYFDTLESFNKKYKYEQLMDNLDVLKKSIAPFILRRLKTEVLKQLPEKIETNIYCEMNKNQGDLYSKFEKQYREKIETFDANKNTFEVLSYITRLRQLAINPKLFIKEYKDDDTKLETFQELVQESIENKKKMVVFSQYTELLHILQEKLDEQKIKYYYLDGLTKPKKRLEDTEKFNKNSVPVYLISLKAGGIGLNLTGANNVVIYDPWWNPAVENQSIDRTHRIGQKNTVQVFRLITKKTIEEKILELNNMKKDLIEKVLDNDSKAINQMSAKELTKLLF